MEQKIHEAFAAMTAEADPKRVLEEVRARIPGEETYRRRMGRRLLRTVIAAAAVLALSVTVYAAVKQLSVTIPENGEYDYLVKVTDGSGGEAKIDKDALQELESLAMTQEDIQNGFLRKTFDTWQEAADWLDCGLLVSDLLTPDGTEWGTVTLSAFADGDGKLATVSLTGGCSISGTEEGCSVTVNSPLESWGERFDLVMGYGENDRSRHTTDTIDYTTPSGFPVQIVNVGALYAVDGTTVRKYATTLHLYHGGILYSIHIDGRHTDPKTDLAYMLADSLR
ncbi:MAG: hypothetical protein IKV57_01355 [Clostridia bacterium]|nr:hypothetical protein [Clostridia bacterium]